MLKSSQAQTLHWRDGQITEQASSLELHESTRVCFCVFVFKAQTEPTVSGNQLYSTTTFSAATSGSSRRAARRRARRRAGPAPPASRPTTRSPGPAQAAVTSTWSPQMWRLRRPTTNGTCTISSARSPKVGHLKPSTPK